MDFRFDDITIHLMPADDKEKDKDKKGEKEKNPRPVQPLRPADDGDPVHGCTRISGSTEKKQTKAGDTAQTLAFLRAQLRETLSPPPL
ncbi:MAG TPA: hypothetical protein VN493_10465 [Thermoanaerobaculia bacterium]|nr:hypothetical protein [Thermoanaerobaculia bacterium]